MWIKNFLGEIFCCHCPPAPTPPVDESDDPNDRGFGPNRKGYIKRQIRFFGWKMISQILSSMVYLALAPILRYGINNKYYLFNECNFTLTHFRYSMVFAGADLLFEIVTLLLGLLFIYWRRPVQLKEVIKIHRKNLRSLTYVGFVIALTATNAILAISFLLYHFKIWYAWKKEGDSLSGSCV